MAICWVGAGACGAGLKLLLKARALRASRQMMANFLALVFMARFGICKLAVLLKRYFLT